MLTEATCSAKVRYTGSRSSSSSSCGMLTS